MSFFGLDDWQPYPIFHVSSHYSFAHALTYRPSQFGFAFLLELYSISSASAPSLVHLPLYCSAPLLLRSANTLPPKLAISRQQTHDLRINGSLGE